MADSLDHQAHELPEHDFRHLMAIDDGEPLVAFRSLEAASVDPDATVVLSGDYGGTIFLTVPARLVQCSLATLKTLVADLDAVTWMSGDLTVASVAIERAAIGFGVSGGDGGGEVIDGVWTQPHRLPSSIRAQAADVVSGRLDRIDIGLLQAERKQELERKRAWRERQRPLPRNMAWDFDISAPARAIRVSTAIDERSEDGWPTRQAIHAAWTAVITGVWTREQAHDWNSRLGRGTGWRLPPPRSERRRRSAVDAWSGHDR